MKAIGRILPIGFVALFCWTGALFADYTLVLKNGRRITAKSYREEGGVVKVHGLGGEFGIRRGQIQSIIRAGEGEQRGMVLPDLSVRGLPAQQQAGPQTDIEQSSGGAAGAGRKGGDLASPGPGGEVKEEGEKRGRGKERVLTPEERLVEKRAKEEEEYLKRVRKITELVKALRDRYSFATRGSAGPEPSLLTGEEAIRARTADLNSRLRDAQYTPGGPSDAGGVKLSTPSSFAGSPSRSRELRFGGVTPRVNVPPPRYSAKEKELSELRNQINKLQRERERLIQEMKEKDFVTGSVFLE
ncbi:MAG: hypothetical protein ACE5JU_07945 [Candidatus Binatia bacterium]